MKLSRLNVLLAASGVVSACLVGCGGGGSSGDSSAPVTVAPEATVNVPVRVVDGAIFNATVCLDVNANGACDAGEPQGKTDADGNSTLVIAAADAGKYPIVAIVGTDAVDADNGPVTVGYTMKAPADSTAVVTPLTTLVQAHIEATNTTTAEAEAAVKDQLGISTSLLADFSKGSDADSVLAGTLARLIVVTKQEQVAATAGATSTGGAALTQAQIESAVNARLLQLLPQLIQAASDPAVATGTDAAALLAAAQALAAEAGLTKDNLGTVVAVNQQAGSGETGTSESGMSATLRWFTFTDTSNFMYRVFRSTPEQATVDVNGKRHYDEYRERKSTASGSLVHSEWNPDANSGSVEWLRYQAFWTGTEWLDCPTNYVHEATPWSATGESESLYCNSYKSKNKRSARDIAGVKLIDLVKEIRAYPLADTAGKFSQWGPNPDDATVIAALGDKTFPAGAKLYYYTGTPLVNPDAYSTLESDIAKVYPANIANGDATACASVTAANSATFQTEAATLEEVIARAPGLPCVYTTNASTGTRNEAWGTSTISIGDVTTATPFDVPSAYYKNNVKRIRAAFGANNSVTYLSCLARASDNSARNCTAIGTGTYSIETQGAGRVLRLANVPADAASLVYNRILVEIGGNVRYGFRDKLVVTNQLRLNLPGAQALLSSLGLD